MTFLHYFIIIIIIIIVIQLYVVPGDTTLRLTCVAGKLSTPDPVYDPPVAEPGHMMLTLICVVTTSSTPDPASGRRVVEENLTMPHSGCAAME